MKKLVGILMLFLGISCFGYNPNIVPLAPPNTPNGNVKKEMFGDKLYYTGKILNDISQNTSGVMSEELADIVLEILSMEKPYLDFGCDFTVKEIFYLFLAEMKSYFSSGLLSIHFEQTSKDSFIMFICYYHDDKVYIALDGTYPYTALYFKINVKHPISGGEYFSIEELGMMEYYGQFRNYDVKIIESKEMAEFLLKNYDKNRKILNTITNDN